MLADTWIVSVLLLYFTILLGIGVVQTRELRDMADYLLAGRRLSTLTAALSAGSSSISGWTMLVLPTLALQRGLNMVWVALTLTTSSWLAWTVLARRLRRYTIAARNSLTIPEFIERRFDDRTGTLRTVAALITIFFVVFYVSSGLIAGAKLLDTIFAVNYTTGIITTLVAVASYAFIGGFFAVSRTDVFQAFLMLAGIIMLPITVIVSTGDPFPWGDRLPSGFWNPFTTIENQPLTPFFVLSTVGWGLGAFGAQRVMQRFMAVGSERQVPASRNIATLWTGAMFGFALLLGLVAFPALAEAGTLSTVLADPERVYFVVAEAFFHPGVVGLVLAAVIAAVMSTADSQLLLAAAVATDDLPIIRRLTYAISTRDRMWLGRLLLVIMAIVAALLSIFNPKSVFNVVAFAWGGMGAAFGPVTLLALYWRRFNFWGALAAMITGTVVASIWGFPSGGPSGVMDINPATPGFVVSLAVAIAVTLSTSRPAQQVVSLFDRVTRQPAPPAGS